MPKKKNPNSGYFKEEQEQYFKDFLTCKDYKERDKIFREHLYEPFSKMISSIIRGCVYSGGKRTFFIEGENFDETFSDCYSYLIEKAGYFNPDLGYKAYSYMQTIVKNYLLHKRKSLNKNKQMYCSYNLCQGEIDDNLIDEKVEVYKPGDLIDNSTMLIQEKLLNEKNLLPNERMVGEVLVDIFQNWKTLFKNEGVKEEEVDMESKLTKINKIKVLGYIKERTGLNTVEIRNAMSIYKDEYIKMVTNQ